MSNATGMLVRWHARLFDLNLDIFYREDIKNRTPYALSRPKSEGKDNLDVNDDIPVATTDLDEDRNETNDIATCRVYHIRDHKNHKAGTMMTEVQVPARQEDPNWDRQPTFAEFIASQVQDPACQKYATTIDHPESKFSTDSIALLERQSTIDRQCLQTVVPKVLQSCLFYLAHNPSSAGHSGQRRSYDSMIPEYYWTHMLTTFTPRHIAADSLSGAGLRWSIKTICRCSRSPARGI